MADEKLLTPDEAAERLGVTQECLRGMRRRGDGPDFFRVGPRLIRYSPAALARYLSSRRGRAAERAAA